MHRFVLLLVALFSCAQIALSQPTIFLVRHAEKAAADTSADPNDPELSEAGRARAELLAKMLKDAGLSGIYASEFKRTQQTAEPIARGVGVRLSIVPAKSVSALVSKLKKTKGTALVVGHSNTLPEIIKALSPADTITIKEEDYDNFFVLCPGDRPRLIRLHY